MYFYKYVDDEMKERDVNLFICLEINYVEIFGSWQCLKLNCACGLQVKSQKKC